jgi:hypothetical protein
MLQFLCILNFQVFEFFKIHIIPEEIKVRLGTSFTEVEFF